MHKGRAPVADDCRTAHIVVEVVVVVHLVLLFGKVLVLAQKPESEPRQA